MIPQPSPAQLPFAISSPGDFLCACTLPSCLHLLKKVSRKLNPYTGTHTQSIKKKKKNQGAGAGRRVREHRHRREDSAILGGKTVQAEGGWGWREPGLRSHSPQEPPSYTRDPERGYLSLGWATVLSLHWSVSQGRCAKRRPATQWCR